MDAEAEYRRHKLWTGLAAGGCLGAGLVWAFASSGESPLVAPLIRTGLVLGPLWLALPRKRPDRLWNRLTGVSVLLFVAAVFLFAYRPLYFLPLFLGLLVLSAFSWGPPPKPPK